MCCRAFPLNHFWRAGTTLKTIRAWLRKNKFSFRPLRRYTQWVGTDVVEGTNVTGVLMEQWLFSCPKLGPNGRCTIYKDRPELCKTYEPGNDMMCVHVRGPDGRPFVPQRGTR